ncbi:PTS system, galactitol-specific IIB component [Dendrosporobacter quercicolus]|uniref:PTS system, galactitol-specific IIB component n=1 Tax=Dendrosporobacter quercicolus TaxID=146817 RepID=A0A1G9YRI7_9FIRM|nr:PTS sugar transporter [Dendrosporobacter quercicolus]SDN11225.1 PTS system, galactitol-specific IIB component [Dendrosporobacter quercicolus]
MKEVSAMEKEVTVLCCCGAGICTSNYLREEIEERIKQEGLKNVKVVLCRVNDVEEAIVHADLLVTTVEMKAEYPVPMIRALGIMLDDAAAKKALDQIIAEIRKIQQ